MESQEFRTRAHEFVDWMADYLDRVSELPVKAQVEPGEILARLPSEPPRSAESFDQIFDDFESIIVPGMTHWQHPSFHAYFPANSSRPSVLAEMLTATLGAQCMSWETSPAATELEIRILDWLRQMIGLPPAFVGSIQDTASTATLCAMLVARERATGYAVNERGAAGVGSMTAYCSNAAHSSVEKDAKIVGVGQQNLRKIPVDSAGAMIPEVLDRTIAEDLESGHTPTCVVATVGTTGASGFDPLGPIAAITQRQGVWLHVDAAWAGSALLLPEYRALVDGVEHADSFVFNPHKWLFTNFDCSAFYVRDRDALLRTFEIHPEYLKTRQDSVATNYRDWGIQLGRRFRALKLWFVIRSYGVDGLRSKIRSHIEMAKSLATDLEAARDFEVLVPPTLSLFCFRFKPRAIDDESTLDELNETLLHRLNDGGKLYLTHTRVRGMFAIRFVVGQTETEAPHVKQAWQLIQEAARSLVTAEPR
jgi:aromatic-L-amino-acid decarboxylase